MQGGYSTRFFLILVPVLFIRVFATRLLLKPQNALFRAAKHYWKSFCTFAAAAHGKCVKMGAEMVLDVTLIGVGNGGQWCVKCFLMDDLIEIDDT